MTFAQRALARGNIWAITHRCHKGNAHFLHAVERRRYLYWLFHARRRFGLSILNFSVHPTAVHLQLMDKGRGEISASMQSVAERMEADFNRRHQRVAPFWEARYQASMSRPDEPLLPQLTDLDMLIVQAGIAAHPLSWRESGFYETLYPPLRARRVDITALQRLLQPRDLMHLQQERRLCVARALHRCSLEQHRLDASSDSLAASSDHQQDSAIYRNAAKTLERPYRLVKGLLLPGKPFASKLVP